MRALVASLIAAPLVLGALPAFGQSSPSADQIIRSLKPTGNLSGGDSRGIRIAPQGSDAVPSQAPAPVPGTAPAHPRTAASRPGPVPATPATAPAVNLTVNFATDSAELTPQAMRTLNELGRALASKELSNYRFRIEGHTDTVGTRDYNRVLSERRAAAVVNYVARTFGVDPDRLQAVGMGDEGLLVMTPPQTPEPRNRRVQVINIGT